MKIIQNKKSKEYKTKIPSNGRILCLLDSEDQSGIIDPTNAFASLSLHNKNIISGTIVHIPENANVPKDLQSYIKIGTRIMASSNNVVYITENDDRLFMVYYDNIEAVIPDDFEYQPKVSL